MLRPSLGLVLALAVGALAPPAATAQVGAILRKKAQERVEKRTTGAVDSTAARDSKSPARARADTGSAVKPGEGAWANYDFVPGDTVLFYEDFTNDNVGDFPKRLEFMRGNMEVVEWQGARYLRARQGGGAFAIALPAVLPDRFTMEFDYSGPTGQDMAVVFGGKIYASPGENYVGFSNFSSGVGGGAVRASGGSELRLTNKVFRARIMADGRYVKVYMNEARVANVPNANLGRASKIIVTLPPNGEKLIGNITIAAGGRKLYDALAEAGRVATHGILFDFNSDRLRPESTPTLAQIGEMLKAHPDLRLVIEGHTDDVGDNAFNQTLSEQRAVAVKQYLIDKYAIETERLTTKGYGSTKPVSSNATPEGRQNNRRVELVRA